MRFMLYAGNMRISCYLKAVDRRLACALVVNMIEWGTSNTDSPHPTPSEWLASRLSVGEGLNPSLPEDDNSFGQRRKFSC